MSLSLDDGNGSDMGDDSDSGNGFNNDNNSNQNDAIKEPLNFAEKDAI